MDNTFKDSEHYSEKSRQQFAEDRARQGWALPEIWNLGEGLSTWLGTALHKFREVDEPIHLRETGFWDDLTRHANALERFGDFDDELMLLRTAAAQDYVRLEEERKKAAQDALRWVADNLGTLWS